MSDTPRTAQEQQTPHTCTSSSKELEAGQLYAVLANEFGLGSWAFFVPNPAVLPIGTSGTVFFLLDRYSANKWMFMTEKVTMFLTSSIPIAILGLANVGFLGEYQVIVETLQLILKTVSIPRKTTIDFDSRTWFLQAVRVLDDCGVVQCEDSGMLEKEMKTCQMDALFRFRSRHGWKAGVLTSFNASNQQAMGITPVKTVVQATSFPSYPKDLDPEQLYIVLTYRGELALWNWSFFVPDPSVSPVGSAGTTFRVVDPDLKGSWKFDIQKEGVISSSPLVVTIVRLADISILGDYRNVVEDVLVSMFTSVHIPTEASTEFSSQRWCMDAIHALHDFGVIVVDRGLFDQLGKEIKRHGFDAMANYLENKGRDILIVITNVCRSDEFSNVGWTYYQAEMCS
ncbi:hypothetical protein JR316_0009897 [Psilocybe cubensis]|uniref:Uncharacterized protein n=1 Tax=Psilocybe cubensis TaxID=181762 RepID=A0ACB8GR22_PSICU|nr:hypothetical protein JR316_0009897 [Psilocybe cubensis]KAH9477671.1 hypothetical protein JR316_0009897 [Psilocybe cubensis]